MEMTMNRQFYNSNCIWGDYLDNSVMTILKEMKNTLVNTFGPHGSHYTIDRPEGAYNTKDGMKVLGSMMVDGSISNSIHRMGLGVSMKQVGEIGDGSTSTLLLMCEFYERLKQYQSVVNVAPTELKNAMEDVSSLLINMIKDTATKVGLTENRHLLRDAIFTTVDGDDKLTDILLEVLDKIDSDDPFISLDLSDNDEHHYKMVSGVEVEGNFFRPDIFNKHARRKVIDKPIVLIVNGRFDMKSDMFITLVEHMKRNEQNLVIICTGVGEGLMGAVNAIYANQPEFFLRVTFMLNTMTSSSEEFLDRCSMFGCTQLEENTFKVLEPTQLIQCINNHCGGAEKVVVFESRARFNNPTINTEIVKNRIEEYEEKIRDIERDPDSHNVRESELRKRIRVLSMNYAKLYIGGASAQRKSINYELMDDAMLQASSARQFGVIDGCNIVVPRLITEYLESNKDKIPSLQQDLLEIIKESYIQLFTFIVSNKYGYEKAVTIVKDHINKNGYVPMNIRNGANHSILNSANTDMVILKNATDMAVLLATSKGFLSSRSEFAISSKQDLLTI